MGHKISPENMVSDQTMTPGKNPETFIQQDNRGVGDSVTVTELRQSFDLNVWKV